MDKIKRNHKLIILPYTVSTIKTFWFLIIIVFTNGFSRGLLLLLGALIVAIINSFIKWYNITYIVHEGLISYKRGVLEKNSVEVPYNKITTFDINQSILQKLFGVVSVKIDTGAAHKKSEVELFLKEAESEELRALIGSIREDHNLETSKHQQATANFNNAKVFNGNLKDVVLYSLTQNNLFIAIGLLFSVENFLDDILKAFNIDIGNIFSKLESRFHIFKGSILTIILVAFVLVIIFTVISTIISTIASIIKYADYSLYRDKNRLIINYGILTKRNYTFSIDKINAVVLKQNILRQIFGLYKVQLSAVGYGDEKQEAAILYPLCNKKKFEYIINEMLPEFVFNSDTYKVPKEGRRRFFLIPIISSLCVFVVVALSFPKAIYIFFLLIVVVLMCFMNYKNSALGFTDKHIYASSGIIFKRIGIMPINKLQAFSFKTNYFQRRKRTCDYIFHGFGTGVIFSAKNLKNIYAQKLKEII